jgi:hypothetical protein
MEGFEDDDKVLLRTDVRLERLHRYMSGMVANPQLAYGTVIFSGILKCLALNPLAL